MRSNKPIIRSDTDPIAIKSLSEKGSFTYTHYHNLPGKRVLLLTREIDTDTTLKIFSANDLQTPLKEKVIPDSRRQRPYSLSGIFPDGSFLLRETERHLDKTASLIRVCPDTLELLSTQDQEDYSFFRDAGIINNEHFFVITDRKPGGEHMLCLLSFDAKNKKYVTISKTSPFADLKDLPDRPEKTLSLGKNRYCCAFTTFGKAAFKVVVFDVDPKSHAIKIHGLIAPTQFKSNMSSPSGRILALPNGRLLTYHEAESNPEDHLQIWDTEKLICIKDWRWDKIRGQRRITHPPCQITSFPDSRYLLLSLSNHSCGTGELCLFNTDRLTLKLINLPDKTTAYGDHHVLGNGEVLAFMAHLTYNPLVIEHFDLPEMRDFRERMSAYKMSHYCVSQGMFGKLHTRTSALEKLPEDLRKIIAAHAFPSEAEASFLSKEKKPQVKAPVTSKEEKPQTESCRIM
jgi:hypothetical protein